MMTEDYNRMYRCCVELEQQLEAAEQKARYYQTLAEQAGQARLRETETLSRLLIEHKQVEASLRASEQRFRELFNNSPDAIFVQGSDGTLDVNQAACLLHHMTCDELVGKNAIELVPEGIHGREIRDFSHMETGTQMQFEGLSLTKDGDEIPVDILVSKFSYAGQPAFLLHVHDITERKQAERELAQYRHHLEELVEARTQELQQQIADRERAERQLKISLQEKEVLLKGAGLPLEIDLDTLDSLGLQLVKGLVEEQLNGTLEFLRSRGTTWIIRFHT